MDEQKQKVTSATAKRIRHFRRLNAFSQEELAFRANLNPAYLGQIERGLKCPTIDTLYKISSALGISLSELLKFEASSGLNTDATERLKVLLASVPEKKTEQMLKVMEDLVSLLSP